MNKEQLCEIAMNLIVTAGSAKSYAMKAISLAREFKFDEAMAELDNASKAFTEAHEIQTELISKDLGDEESSIQINLLMVHAQDHLTMGLMTKEFALELINIYRKLEVK